MAKPKFKRRGLSLIECVVGLFMLIGGVMTITALASSSAKITKQGQARFAAASIARQQLDALDTAAPTSRPLVADKAFTIPDDAKRLFPGATSTSKITGSYSIAAVPGKPDLQMLIVTVRWKNFADNTGSATGSSVTLSRITTMPGFLTSYSIDTETEDEDLFYTPPPPPTTTGGSDGGSTGGSSDGGSTGGTSDGGSSGGSSTGSSTGGSTGASSGGSTSGGGYPGMGASYGSKWK